MKPYFVKTPQIIQTLLKNYLWRFSTKKNRIYLTFDDGPTPEITPWVLEELAKYNAKATFFCIGKNIEQHPALFKKILKENHVVGNHTYNHLNGWKTPNKKYINNILKTASFFEKGNKLFRPPYGKLKPKQAKQLRQLSYQIVMWNVLSADFDTYISKETCLQNVVQNASNGSIIVFHDSLKGSDKLRFVLPKILEHYAKKGFEFSAITTRIAVPNQ